MDRVAVCDDWEMLRVRDIYTVMMHLHLFFTENCLERLVIRQTIYCATECFHIGLKEFTRARREEFEQNFETMIRGEVWLFTEGISLATVIPN